MTNTTDILVTVRTKTAELLTGATLDEALEFLTTDTTPRRMVELPSGGLIAPNEFAYWVKTVKAAAARVAARKALAA